MTLPAIDDFDANYNGVKQDYSEPIDPTTDLPAAASNQVRASTAGLTRTGYRVFVVWNNNGSDGYISDFDSVVGSSFTNHPTITRIGAGNWQFEFPASCTDFLGEEQFWNFRYALGDVLSGSAPYKVQCIVSAPNVIDIYIWDLFAVGLDDASSQDIVIEVR